MTYTHNVKRHFTISLVEKKSWWLTSAIIGLVVFFFIWRTTDFTIQSGAIHFISIILMSWIIIGFLLTAAKLIAITKKYTANYSSWLNGLLIGFVISFISYGYIPIIFPGNIEIETIERLRHGKVFPGENKTEISFVLTWTIIATVLLTTIFQSIYLATKFIVFKYGVIVGALVVFFALLPFPNNIGLHLFYVNRKRYYFMGFFALAFCIAIIAGSTYSILIAILCGLVGFFFFKSEKRNRLERDD